MGKIGKILDLVKGPAFVVVVSLGLLSLLIASNVPWRTPYKPFIVLSGSMRPTITEGSVVFVQRGFQQLSVGNIVTFIRPDNLRDNVTHRIVGETDKGFRTQGDANNSPDVWIVRKEAVWGKVIFSLPYLGYVLSFSRTKPGVILLIVLPLSIIILDEIRVILNELRKKRNRRAPTNQIVVEILILAIGISNLFYGKGTTSLAYFSHNDAVTNNQLVTNCWIAPTAPALLSPADGAAANTSDITFSWGASTSSCPTAIISYNFQLTSVNSGLTIAHADGIFVHSLSVINLQEGNYQWHVSASDGKGNLTSSNTYAFTIDKTSPSASLSITGSWTKVLEEKIVNGNFSDGLSGWTTAGDVAIVPNGSGSMARIGNSSDPGNYVWENRLMQSFSTGAKSLAIDYNFFTDDYDPFDNPGFFIRLNGQEVFATGSGSLTGSSGWQQFVYDLSTFSAPKINLAIYAGNAGSKTNQSWANVSKVSTYFVAAPAHATYSLSSSESGGHCEYKIDSADWVTGNSFTGLSAGTHAIDYRCFDNAGNNSSNSSATIITDDSAPNSVTDLRIDSTYENAVTLAWTAPGNDGSSGRAVQYDVRYSTSPITDDTSFSAATKVDKVPSPQDSGNTEILEVLGLNPSATYYFSLKTADEAPNWSGLSNDLSATTETSAAEINSGDIIINELMWPGTSVSDADQYLELRNMTNRIIDLSGLTFTKYDNTPMDIDLAGKSIPAHGYFLIANGNSYAGGDSQLTVSPDLWDSSLDLNPDNLHIKLLAGSTLIDEVWDDSAVTEGLKTGDKYYSMERTSVPGDGANPLSWYTCIDSASTAEFFDGGADERGTPGAENRSENEPFVKPTPAASASAKIAEPGLVLELSGDGKSVSFRLENVADFIKAKYELTYDTDSSPQGVLGEIQLLGTPEFKKDGILLGTCSTGGTCVYHSGVKNIFLKVKLTDKTDREISLEGKL